MFLTRPNQSEATRHKEQRTRKNVRNKYRNTPIRGQRVASCWLLVSGLTIHLRTQHYRPM